MAFPWRTNSKGPTVYAFHFIPYSFATLPLACSYDGLEPAAFSQSWMTPPHRYVMFHTSKVHTLAEMVGHTGALNYLHRHSRKIPVTTVSCANVLRASFAQRTSIMSPKTPPVHNKPCLCKKPHFVSEKYQCNYSEKAPLGSSYVTFTF